MERQLRASGPELVQDQGRPISVASLKSINIHQQQAGPVVVRKEGARVTHNPPFVKKEFKDECLARRSAAMRTCAEADIMFRGPSMYDLLHCMRHWIGL